MCLQRVVHFKNNLKNQEYKSLIYDIIIYDKSPLK